MAQTNDNKEQYDMEIRVVAVIDNEPNNVVESYNLYGLPQQDVHDLFFRACQATRQPFAIAIPK